MKKIFLFFLFITIVRSLSGQTHGITYQAVIFDPDPAEIPGVDITGNFLPNHELSVRFTILDQGGNIEYQEEHTTTTDKYGMITLTIGLGTMTSFSPATFTEIDWNGSSKDLRVEISLDNSGTGYNELSFQRLYFVPYAFHRNITATGTMIIDGASTLNNSLEVANGSPTSLSGSLAVGGTSDLNGQVTITAYVNGDDDQYNSYPLRVQGSNQGIGITIDGSRTSANNFITFWDATGIQGRIEGQVDADVYNDPQFIYDQAMFAGKTAVQIVNIATAAAAAVLDPGNVIIEAANSALLVAEIAEYEIFAFTGLGVGYESGSGDYAEWLPRLYPEEQIDYGQIVGVYGGKVSKKIDGADMLMVVSKSPIVLGNMPADNASESLYEKIAFMGQVPVRVVGKVSKGDYIISYKSGSGLGIAVSPSKLSICQMNCIVGRAWSDSGDEGIKFVNTVVGIKTNEWISFIRAGSEEIDSLKKEIAYLRARISKSENVLARLVPGYSEAMISDGSEAGLPGKEKPAQINNGLKSDFRNDPSSRPVLTREIILDNFAKSAAFLETQGIDLSKNHFYSRLKSDPDYKELVVRTILNAGEKNKTTLPK